MKTVDPDFLSLASELHELQLPLPFLDLSTTSGRREAPLHLLVSELAALRRENVSLRRQLTELRNYRRLSLRDVLTELYNRRYFDRRLKQELSRARRHGDQPVTILLIDLDDFKQINDRFGHARGDEALVFVAEFLRQNTRRHDVCCRFAGDEYVVILPHTDRQQSLQFLDRLRERFDAQALTFGLPLSISVGAATFPIDGADEDALFRAADAAMYADKAARKG